MITKREWELINVKNDAIAAMLEKLSETKNNMEFGYVIGLIMLDLSHTVRRVLPYKEEN